MPQSYLATTIFLLAMTTGIFCLNCPAYGQETCRELFTQNSHSELIQTRNGWGDIVSQRVHYHYEGGERVYNRTNRDLRQFEQDGGVIFKKFIDSLIASGGRFLDAGTGDGKLVYELRQKGVSAIGLDVALNSSQKAEAIFVERDIRSTGFEPNSFDKVLSSFAVFHYLMPIEFRIQALRELIRITRPGGEILLVGFESLAVKAIGVEPIPADLHKGTAEEQVAATRKYWENRRQRIIDAQNTETALYLKEFPNLVIEDFNPVQKEGGVLLLRKLK